jgi:Uncharacterized conserved protein
MKLVWLLLLGTLFIANSVYSWYYGNWLYRVPITIQEKSGNNLTDYQVMLRVSTYSLISAGKMRSDCGDIRFTYLNTLDNKEYEIPYWIESGCNSSNTIIWIKVPYIPANGTTTIYMYYGNPKAVSRSNGDAVFEFFDDFNGPDTSKWVYTAGHSYGFDDPGTGYGKGIWFSGDANGDVSTRTTRKFTNNIVIEARIWKNVECANHFIYISQSTSATWAWSSTSGIIRFAWNCDNKYIYGQSSSIYTSRPNETHYDIRIIIIPTKVVFMDWYTDIPSNINALTLFDTMNNFYIYIGADQDSTSYKSYFYWIRVRKYAPIEPTYLLEQNKLTLELK